MYSVKNIPNAGLEMDMVSLGICIVRVVLTTSVATHSSYPKVSVIDEVVERTRAYPKRIRAPERSRELRLRQPMEPLPEQRDLRHLKLRTRRRVHVMLWVCPPRVRVLARGCALKQIIISRRSVENSRTSVQNQYKISTKSVQNRTWVVVLRVHLVVRVLR